MAISKDEIEVMDYLQETIDKPVSDRAIDMMRQYLAKYGSIKVTRMIGGLKEADISYAMTIALGELLKNKFEDKLAAELTPFNTTIKLEQPSNDTSIAGINARMTQESKAEARKKRESARNNKPPRKERKSSDQTKEECDLALVILEENKAPMRLADLFKKLAEYDVVIGTKYRTNVIRAYMNMDANIVRVGEGMYSLEKYKDIQVSA